MHDLSVSVWGSSGRYARSVCVCVCRVELRRRSRCRFPLFGGNRDSSMLPADCGNLTQIGIEIGPTFAYAHVVELFNSERNENARISD